jgi:molybdopterin converting factor small subunit
MQITVRLLATYRRYLPQGHDTSAGYAHQIPPGTRVGEVIAELPIPQRDPFTFFVNGRHADGDDLLQEGDVLAVFPAVGGG